MTKIHYVGMNEEKRREIKEEIKTLKKLNETNHYTKMIVRKTPKGFTIHAYRDEQVSYEVHAVSED